MTASVHEDLVNIVGPDSISDRIEILEQFSGSKNMDGGNLPSFIVWPSTAHEVSEIVKLANKTYFPIVPVSSGVPRMNGSTISKRKGSIIIDLGKMNRILRVDSKNKVVMIEPGVTYAQILPELRKAGLRPLMPLLPKASQSVLASCLDREPTIIPRFHWDISDPLLCTETIFGTGEMLRTGSASGPGGLEEQWASGQAQKNPMGPSQFDPFRLIQGSQGTIGIVTWITMKCEVAPDTHQCFIAGSETLESLQRFNYSITRRRLVDEHFMLNSGSLSELLGEDLRTDLPEWILVLGISGHGPLAQDEFDYRLADTQDIAKVTGITLETEIGVVKDIDIQGILNVPSSDPYWKLKSHGGCREVSFISTLDMIPEFYSLFIQEAEKNGFGKDRIGAYVQPIVQGVNTSCCFDIYFNPQEESEITAMENLYVNGAENLMDSGAYFSRPPPALRKAIYSRSSPEVNAAMNRVKRIFDPHNILNPGNLCFEEVQ